MTRVQFKDLLAEPVRNGVYKPKQFHGSGVRIVNMKELFSFDTLSNQPESRIELTPAELTKATLRDGDLLFARRSFVLAGAGKCSLVVDPPEALTFESSMIRARPDPARADPRFLFYYFKSPQGRARMASIAARTAVSGITGSSLSALEIDIPDVEGQSRIANVLRQFDELIENNRRRVEVLEEIARTIYREWFVNFRYPGHEDVPFIDSPLGPIPEGWRRLSLFDASDVGFGFSFKSSRFSAEGPSQVIRIRDIPVGISSTFTDEVADVRYGVHDNDVLIGMDGDFHMTVWTGGDAWLNQRVTRLRPKVDMSPLHLLLAIEGQIIEWNRAIVGTTVAHLGKKHLELVTVVVPDDATLARASSLFNDLMGQRRTLVQSNRRLAALRDLLLPKLVTGQIEVSTLDLDWLVSTSSTGGFAASTAGVGVA